LTDTRASAAAAVEVAACVAVGVAARAGARPAVPTAMATRATMPRRFNPVMRFMIHLDLGLVPKRSLARPALWFRVCHPRGLHRADPGQRGRRATMPARLRYLCGGSMLLLAACATRQTAPPPAIGDASWAMKVPAASQRYQLATGNTATGANLTGSVTPIYPAALLSMCPPPQEVQALVIVDKAGRVSGMRVADEAQPG